MDWFPKVVFYMGLLDAGLVMVCGIVVCILMLLDKPIEGFFGRVGPALCALIGSNVAAAVILWGTRAIAG